MGTSLPVDWGRLLADFIGQDAHTAGAAAFAFSGVAEGTLRALGAYQRRSSWEDLIHDVLLALFEHAPEVEYPAAWVRRATFNAYVDWARREATRNAKSKELGLAMDEAGDSAYALLDVSVVTKQELEELRCAVAKLPRGLRSVVDVVYPRDPLSEPSNLSDAAKSLGVELHTLKNRLRRAIEMLGRELRRERNLRRFRKEPGHLLARLRRGIGRERVS